MLVSQVREWVPQLPQLSVLGPLQGWPVHALVHSQLLPQVWVPPAPQPRVSLGAHTPPPAHVDQSDQVPLEGSQVRVCVPWLQLPHACELDPGHGCPAHSRPHSQSPPQVCVPPAPQARVSVGTQLPSPLQLDHDDQLPVSGSQLRLCAPQRPHSRVASPLQLCPVHAPQRQSPPQTCVPPVPHAWLSSELHSPWSVHAPQSDQLPPVHTRTCVPQLPQLRIAGPSHSGTVGSTHCRHAQSPPHVCTPSPSQLRVSSGAHSPSPRHDA